MAPNCRLLAFYFRDNGEVVPDSMSVSVQGTSDNPVNVTFSVETAKPGDTVNLVISAKPNTTIFLLSVDKSVQLLKSGNDITQDTITEELVSYDYGSGFYGYWRYMFICGWPYPSRGSDASQVFNDANVIILTDGLVYEKPIERYPYLAYSNAYGLADDGAQPPAALGSPVERIRKNFPETWLWSVVVVGSSGIYIQPEIAPDTITTWLTTAIAVHPLYGLSVTPKPAEITTFLPLFVTLNMPYSVIRGEDICMKAFAFNYYETALKMTLTMGKTDGIQVIRLQRNNRKPKGVEEVRQSISVSHYLGTVNPDTVATRTSASRRSSWGHCPSGSTSQHPQSLETV
ncbi:CD109 antigen-like isoform X2 [Pomacea canaliculata]|uniref:CD109 antigen-like isoform X2 n=1 Tax=Pomacea canaliculata TaxID=400727 RepID=UPI000D734C6E|nr:CD109 antigen-like isoform X2 [Pomacea canaliculata]